MGDAVNASSSREQLFLTSFCHNKSACSYVKDAIQTTIQLVHWLTQLCLRKGKTEMIGEHRKQHFLTTFKFSGDGCL